MPVKAIGWIQSVSAEDQSELTYNVSLRIVANGDNTNGTAGPFQSTSSSLTVNAALRAKTQEVAEQDLGESFTPIIDSVVLLNPLAIG